MNSSTFYGGVTIIFPLQPCRIKRFLLLPNICACCSLQFPEIKSPSLSIYLTKTSNWAHEVTSVNSSTWKKHWDGDAFISLITWSFTSSGISEMPLWTVSLEEIFVSCLPHYLLQEVVLLFQQTGFYKQFFQSWEFFCLAMSSATSYDACLIGGTSSKIVWRFKVASWLRKNSITFCGVVGMLCL